MVLTLFADQVNDPMCYDDATMFMPSPVGIKQEPETETSASEMSDERTYTDLTAAEYPSSKLSLFKQEQSVFPESFDNLLSWTNKHPEHWTAREVLDWVYYVADYKQFDCPKFCGERFQALSGQQLCNMTKKEFLSVDSHYGSVLYDLFQSLLPEPKFLEPPSPESINLGVYPYLDTTYPCLPIPFSPVASERNLSVFVNDQGDTSVKIDGCMYDIDTKSDILYDPGYCSGDSEMEGGNTPRSQSTSSDPDAFVSDDDDIQMTPYGAYITEGFGPRSTTSVSSEEDMAERRPAPKRKMPTSSKGNHLWEFVRDLLKDPNFNPSLIKWEDKESGVFKFVQSEAVASMWGRKKNNMAMTYEKLSRAMRFCRTAGYFSDVPKNGKFPKKLCFRFGPKAHDWK